MLPTLFVEDICIEIRNIEGYLHFYIKIRGTAQWGRTSCGAARCALFGAAPDSVLMSVAASESGRKGEGARRRAHGCTLFVVVQE